LLSICCYHHHNVEDLSFFLNSSLCALFWLHKQIYELACKHDLIIMEDDPYYYLSYGTQPAPANDAQFVRPTTESFFSMDVDRMFDFEPLTSEYRFIYLYSSCFWMDA
jgi:hypothetical protein